MSLNITDHSSNRLTDADPLLQKCRTAVARRLSRTEEKVPLFIDPLTPLPLADAAVGGPAVRFVYFIMASRSYAHETINRNVRVLQRPGALEAYGSNESNLFLLHVDAKMSPSDQLLLRSRVIARPDVYYLRRTRAVMWAGYSMVLALVDAMGSLVARGLGFDTLINLSDADLTLRVDTEVRGFFARYPGRSIMSIVQRHRDPRRYKLHENFRNYCWVRVTHEHAARVRRECACECAWRACVRACVRACPTPRDASRACGRRCSRRSVLISAEPAPIPLPPSSHSPPTLLPLCSHSAHALRTHMRTV
jgi:hypothetical protein